MVNSHDYFKGTKRNVKYFSNIKTNLRDNIKDKKDVIPLLEWLYDTTNEDSFKGMHKDSFLEDTITLAFYNELTAEGHAKIEIIRDMVLGVDSVNCKNMYEFMSKAFNKIVKNKGTYKTKSLR